MTLDTQLQDRFETAAFQSGIVQAEILASIFKDAGPGIGNVHISTARRASQYFRDYYPNNPAMHLGLEGLTDGQVAFYISDRSKGIQVVTAVVRMLYDYRLGSGTNPNISIPPGHSGWNMADGISIWHGYRYGVPPVSPMGVGFANIQNFQNRGLTINAMLSLGQYTGIGYEESINGAIPIFTHYLTQE